MTLDLSPRRAAIRARLKCALARVGSSFSARENASAAPSRSPAEQVVPEAVPRLRVIRLRVAQQPVDARSLQVVAFGTEARGGERTHVSVDVAFALRERTKERKGLLRATLLEELMGPLHPRGRRRRRCGSGGPFLRHRITAEVAPGRRPSLAEGGAAFPHRRRRRSSRWPAAGFVLPPGLRG